MATITTITFTGRVIPLGSAAAGALYAEVWKVGAGTDGDTQVLATTKVRTVLAIVGGNLEMVAQTADRVVTVITTATVDASNFCHALIIGTE